MGILSSKSSSNYSSTSNRTTVTTNNIVTDSGAIEALKKTASEAIGQSTKLGLGAFDLAESAFKAPIDIINSLTERDEKIVLELANSVQSNIRDLATKIVAPANDIAEQLKEFGIVVALAAGAVFIFRK